MSTGNFPIHDYSREQSDEPDELNERVHNPADPDGVVAAETRKNWQEGMRTTDRPPHKQPHPKHFWIKLAAAVVILVAAAAGSYWLGNHQARQKEPPAVIATKRSGSQTKQSTRQTQTAITPTKNYSSTNYGLSFDYPKTWTVSDTTAKLTITSPPTQLTTADGNKSSVQVVVTMQNPQAAIPGFPANGAVASLASDHVTYKQPSTVQRAQTYVSYLSYSTANGLDALYVTGDNGYQQGQQVPLTDVTKGNPLIGVSFNACPDENCTTPKATALSANAWKATLTSKDVANLLESIVLQD